MGAIAKDHQTHARGQELSKESEKNNLCLNFYSEKKEKNHSRPLTRQMKNLYARGSNQKAPTPIK